MNNDRLSMKWHDRLNRLLIWLAVFLIALGFFRLTGLYKITYHITEEAKKDIDASAYLHAFDIIFGLLFIAAAVLMIVASVDLEKMKKRGIIFLHISVFLGAASLTAFNICYSNLVVNGLTLSVRYYYIRSNVEYILLGILLLVMLVCNIVYYFKRRSYFS